MRFSRRIRRTRSGDFELRLPRDEVIRLAKRLEREMSRAARELQFERAADIRDQLIGLRKATAEAPEAAPAAAGGGGRRATGRRFTRRPR